MMDNACDPFVTPDAKVTSAHEIPEHHPLDRLAGPGLFLCALDGLCLVRTCVGRKKGSLIQTTNRYRG